MQGLMSLILGCFSISLLMTLWGSGYPAAILAIFLVVGIALIFSGDYLLNPFKLPITPRKQEFASDIGLIAYGALYFGIAMSNLLQPRWFTVQFADLLTTHLGAARLSHRRNCPDRCRHLWDL